MCQALTRLAPAGYLLAVWVLTSLLPQDFIPVRAHWEGY